MYFAPRMMVFFLNIARRPHTLTPIPAPAGFDFMPPVGGLTPLPTTALCSGGSHMMVSSRTNILYRMMIKHVLRA
jgi:hypothetical protein